MSTKQGMRRRDHCIRCGECCLKSSPTLLKADLLLIDNRTIKFDKIYTLRKGELVKDNINEKPIFTENELIKVAEKNGVEGGCIFFSESDKSCSIYAHRPSQCSALNCRDTDEFMDVFKKPKLERTDFIKNGVLLGLIKEHEKRCSHTIVEDHVKKIEVQGDSSLEKILDILKFDYQIRPFAAQKLDLDPDHMDLYFGRPLTETITMFGLQVIKESDGTFLLTIKS